MKRHAFDLGVYLVTDRACCGPRGVEAVVRAAIENGATLVQLRDKHVDARPMLALGRQLLTLLRPAGIGLIVNDRIDVAQALDAEGVHIGQQDMAYPDARRLLGPGKIIGISVGSEAEAREAAGWDAAPRWAWTRPRASPGSPAIAPSRSAASTRRTPRRSTPPVSKAWPSCRPFAPPRTRDWPRATSPARCTRIAAGSARRRIPVWRCRRFLGPLVRAWGCGFG
jgi:hypothetical protein